MIVTMKTLAPATSSGFRDSAKQTVRAQADLRRLILDGELASGTRVAEARLVERLGVSRTPIRSALAALYEEGLLERRAGGGYAVRAFSEAEILDGIEVRGTLEGLAARLAAERGPDPGLLAEAGACLDAIDRLQELSQSMSEYAELNLKFHRLVGRLSGSETVVQQLARASSLPFASPNAFVTPSREEGRRRLFVAQSQHRAVLKAIAAREGTRAEALMREHAGLGKEDVRTMLSEHRAMEDPAITRLRLARAPG